MALIKTTIYKGLTVTDARYTVEYITIQGKQLDFFVSMKANKDSPQLDGETHGCSYDPTAGTPEQQAYAYLKTLEEFEGAEEAD